jgi:ABC-type dipeptide/oligopeptide/nickel transport system ATPase component
VLRPELVIADEPTTSLDVLVEAQILSILADLRRNFDTALLLITHNLGIIAEACDRLAPPAREHP